MPSFEEQLAKHTGVSEDYAAEMELPPRLQQQRRREEEAAAAAEHDHEVATEVVEAEREAVGDHGGSGGAAGDQAATSAPEAMPERDQPDDGVHSDSVEEAPAEDVEADAEEAEDEEPEEQPAAEPPVEQADEAAQEPVEEVVPVPVPLAPPRRPEGMEDLSWTLNTKFDFAGAGKQMRVFPESLIVALRAQLLPFGKEFAEEISGPALISAFVAARLGIDFPTDPNTAQAVKAFALLSPELASLEHQVSGLGESVATMAEQLAAVRRDVREATEVARILELSNAYVITDRHEQISPPHATGASIEVRHPQVLATRKNLRKAATAQTDSDRRQEGRSRAWQ